MDLSKKQIIPALLTLVVVAGLFYWLGGREAASPLTDSSGSAKEVEASATTSTSEPAIEDWTVAPKESSAKSTSGNSTSATALSGKLAPELVRPGGFTNTDPLLLRDFRGKRIVLVQFWTTSSLDSVRTIPHLNDWYAKYHNYGLSIVGIHTPRFAFERSKSVVDLFASTHDISYPIVLDTGAETWKAYKNTTWPHLYLIDLDGRIVSDHSGIGGYEATEQKLLELLNTRAKKLKLPAPPEQKISSLPNDGSDKTLLKSSEAFFGSARNANLANGTPGKEGVQTFASLSEPALNKEYLFGGWKITRDYAENLTEHTSIIYRFHAKQVFTIMGAERLIRVKVLLDGKPLDQSVAGKDIRYEKGESVFYVDREHFYDIVNVQSGYADHTIEFTPDTGGLDVYTLTFG